MGRTGQAAAAVIFLALAATALPARAEDPAPLPVTPAVVPAGTGILPQPAAREVMVQLLTIFAYHYAPQGFVAGQHSPRRPQQAAMAVRPPGG